MPVTGAHAGPVTAEPGPDPLGGPVLNHVGHWGIWTMSTFDFSPLFRSTIGFDRLGRMLDGALVGVSSGYPPHNIERTRGDACRTTVAAPGLGRAARKLR